MLISEKLTTFIRRSQLKIAEVALSTASDLDEAFIDNSNVLLAKELIHVISSFQDSLNDWSDKDKEIVIDYYTSIGELNEIAIVDLENKQTVITISDTIGSSDWEGPLSALNSKVDNNHTETLSEIDRLDGRIDSLDFSALIPQEILDAIGANTVARHTHGNKGVLDNVTQQNLDDIALNNTHRLDSQKHVTQAQKDAWTAKVTQSELAAGLNTKADTDHTHELSDVNGLTEAFEGLVPEKGDPGEDGVTPTLSVGSVSEGAASVTIDNTDPYNPVLNFVVPKGENGEDFHIDEFKNSGERLSSSYNDVGDGYSILGLDNGTLYFRRTYNSSGTFIPAVFAAGWTGVQFVGNNGWSPVIATLEVDDTKTVLRIVGWIGGTGETPTGDLPLYVGYNGYTSFLDEAINVRGTKGDTGAVGKPMFPDATGTLENRYVYDDEDADFMYYVSSTGLIYIKRSSASADWSDGYQWKGDQGIQGEQGPIGPSGTTWNVVDVNIDTLATVNKTFFMVSAVLGPVTISLPDPDIDNTGEYAIMLVSGDHKVTIASETVVPGAINGLDTLIVPGLGEIVILQCFGTSGYRLVDDTRRMDTLSTITSDRDFTTDGFENRGSYKISPAISGSSILLTLPVPKTYDNSRAARAAFTLVGAGSFTVVRSDGGLIGPSNQQTVSTVGATITIEEGNGVYNIIQDSRPSLTASTLAFPFYRLGDISDLGSIYYKLTQDRNSPEYGAQQEFLSGAITSLTPINYANYVTDAGLDLGLVPASKVNFVVTTKKVVSTGANVVAYYELHKRDSLGTETLLSTSPNFIITQITYAQFGIIGTFPETQFLATDRLVLKVFLYKTSASGDPELSTLIEGENGAFFSIQLPSTLARHNNLQGRSDLLAHPSSSISHDNSGTVLNATDVESGINELASKIPYTIIDNTYNGLVLPSNNKYAIDGSIEAYSVLLDPTPSTYDFVNLLVDNTETYSVTVEGNGNNIEGSSTLVLDSTKINKTLSLWYDGTEWVILESGGGGASSWEELTDVTTKVGNAKAMFKVSDDEQTIEPAGFDYDQVLQTSSIDVSDPTWQDQEERLLLVKKNVDTPVLEGAAQLIDIFAPPGNDTALTSQSGWSAESKTLTGINFNGELGKVGQIRILADGTICRCISSVAGDDGVSNGSATYKRNRAIDTLDPDASADDSNVCDLLDPTRTGGAIDDGWDLVTNIKVITTVPARVGTWWKVAGSYSYFCYAVSGTSYYFYRSGQPAAIYRYINTTTYPLITAALIAYDWSTPLYTETGSEETTYQDQVFYDNVNDIYYIKVSSTEWRRFGANEYKTFTIAPTANQVTVTFDANKTSATYTITDAIEILQASTGNLRGVIVEFFMIADGNSLHKPTYSTDFCLRSDNWDNTNGVVNKITMKYGNGTEKTLIELSKHC